ncbi:hypothetical protein P4S73_03475 [Paraglaciecola sp. Hal342]
MAISISLFSLSGCGGSGSEPGTTLLTCSVPNVPDASGTSCAAPEPISCAPPTVPDALNESCVVGADPSAPAPMASAAMDEAVLYFNLAEKRADNSPNRRDVHWVSIAYVEQLTHATLTLMPIPIGQMAESTQVSILTMVLTGLLI